MATITEELLVLIRSLGAAAAAADVDKVTGATAKAGAASKKAKDEHLGFGSALKSVKGLAMGAIGVAGLGGIAVTLGESIKSAQNMQVAVAQLGQAVRNNVQHPAKDATKDMEKFADALALKGGFGPQEAMLAMSRLLPVVKSTTEAQKDLTLASDIARATHNSLARSTRAVMMVEAGRTTGLSRMGIFLKPMKTAQDALNEAHAQAVEKTKRYNDHIKALHLSLAAFGETVPKITQAQKDQAKHQDELASRTSGLTTLWKQYGHATDTYSKTAAGSIQNLKNTVDLLEERLGAYLLPAVTKVAHAMSVFVGQMMHGKGVGGEFANVMKDLWDVFKGIFGVMKDIWPVLAGLTALWVYFATVQKITSIWTAITSSEMFAQAGAAALSAGATGELSTAWEMLNFVMAQNVFLLVVIAIAAVVAGLILAYKHVRWFHNAVDAMGKAAVAAFHWLMQAASDAFNWIKHHWPLVIGILTGPIGFAVAEIIKHWNQIEHLPGKLLKMFKDVGNDVANAIVWPFKWAFGWVSKHLPSFHTHHIGPIPIPLPSFPGLAAGGVTPYGGAFVVGERGPELVTLPGGASVSSQQDLAQTNALLRELIVAVRQNSQALVVDGKVLAQSVMRQGLIQQSRA
jgi:hypothetical protein